MTNQRYSPVFKDEAVRQIVDRGYSVTEVSKRLGVSAHSLYKWGKGVSPSQADEQAAACYHHDFGQVGDVGNMLRNLSGGSCLSFVHSTFAAATALAAMAFVSGCSDGDSPTASEGVRPSGRQLFVDHCASCHGTEGRGDGPLATELRIPPTNLRLLAQENDGRFPSRRLQRAIDGRGMPPAHGLPEMPVWGAVWKRQGLSEMQLSAQIISITSYISTLQD